MAAKSHTNQNVKYPYTTSIVSEGRRKLHTTYEDGSEQVEEFDLNGGQLLLRKVRKPTALGGEGSWVVELGEAATSKPFNPEAELLAPSSSNPVFTRKDTSSAFQWRIRNCFFDKQVYSVEIDMESQQIVIRTSNKKYYKRFEIPDLKRMKLPLDKKNLSWSHSNHTLVITYQKPAPILQQEQETQRTLLQMKENTKGQSREGDVQCPQQ